MNKVTNGQFLNPGCSDDVGLREMFVCLSGSVTFKDEHLTSSQYNISKHNLPCTTNINRDLALQF